LQDLDGGASWDLGKSQQMKLDGFNLGLLQIVGKYESLNAVYQSEEYRILRYSVVFGFCRQVSGPLDNVMCRSSLSAVPSLLNHYIYAVSVIQDRGFGLTKARFNIDEEL
jgi:hypothetical protein